jgi:hypothetical protein
MTDAPQAPAGWYQDPQNPGQQRYWNGVEWLAPGPPPPPAVMYPTYMAPRQTVNGFAIASMVLGIIWIYWIGSVLALVFGYIAKRQIAASQGRESGDGFATAGIILGWIGVAAVVILIVIVIIASATGTSSSCEPSIYNSC